VRSGVAWAALKQGKTAEAAKAFRELLEVAPKQPYAAEGLKLALDSKK
jgi:TolA-binding protein